MLQSVWQTLNGNKTTIAGVFLFLALVINEVLLGFWNLYIPENLIPVLQNIALTAEWVGGFFGGTGLAHKALKGVSSMTKQS